MPRMMNVLLATSFALAACEPAERVEPPPSASPAPVIRPIEKHTAVVLRDIDEYGNYVGVYTYPSPWADPKNFTGSYPHGYKPTALCEQEGRKAHDERVPEGAPFVDTNTWIRFAGDQPSPVEGGQWSPKPYFDLGGAMLRQCAEFGLAYPQPLAGQ